MWWLNKFYYRWSQDRSSQVRLLWAIYSHWDSYYARSMYRLLRTPNQLHDFLSLNRERMLTSETTKKCCGWSFQVVGASKILVETDSGDIRVVDCAVIRTNWRWSSRGGLLRLFFAVWSDEDGCNLVCRVLGMHETAPSAELAACFEVSSDFPSICGQGCNPLIC